MEAIVTELLFDSKVSAKICIDGRNRWRYPVVIVIFV